MSTGWKIRHEGSPRSIEGLVLPQVIEGLQDGLWEPTDEVMGPQDPQWVAIENHADLAEAVADLVPPPAKVPEDETRLDMNPLIDVALVLLIFFILTASYAALQRVLAMPESARDSRGTPIKSQAYVDQRLIKVKARMESGQAVIRVEDEIVAEKDLVGVLSRTVREKRKTEMLIDALGVEWGTVVAIQDAARGAGIERAHYLTKPK